MTASATPCLRLDGIGHRFGLHEVLAEIDFTLMPGETLALVGPSGCGKSTLLSIAAGLLHPSQGKVSNSFQRIGQMFQEPRLLPWKTARQNIALGLKAQGVGRTTRHAVANALAQRLGLSPEDGQKYPHALSGGMQSRVALARALAVEPDLLLLDEPFSALDVGLKHDLYALVQNEADQHQCAVLMITHDLMEAVRLADRILLLAGEPGRLTGEFTSYRPRTQRSDDWVYRRTALLMHDPAVRAGFGLPGLPMMAGMDFSTEAAWTAEERE